MTLFDLVFAALLLAALCALVVACSAALTGHRATAAKVVNVLGIALVAYLAVVYAVAIASAGRVLALGEDTCWDDWCIAVDSVRDAAAGDGRAYDVTFRISSRARRVTQRERGIVAYLRDTRGRRFDGESGPSDAGFDARLGPGESVRTHRRFSLPSGAAPRDIVITHRGIPFPGCCIIGEATELLHPASVRLAKRDSGP